MAQCVKCLAFKYENQSSNPQDPYKSQPGLTDSYNSVGRQRQRFPSVSCLAVLAGFSERPCLNKYNEE